MRRLYNLWLFAGFGAVVGAFVLATFFLWLTFDVREETKSLLEDALPSAEYLSAADGELRTLEMATIARAAAAPAEAEVLKARADASVGKIQEELDAYAATPFYPGEHELFDETRGRFAQLRAVIGREGGNGPAFSEAVSGLDASLIALTQFNIAYGKRVSTRIGGIWQRATAAAVVLDLAAAGVAVLCMLSFRRVLQRDLELSEMHQRATELRAAELEAFAGRIAHDLRNPLSALAVGTATAGKLAEDNPERLPYVLGRMRSGIERMETLIEGLLAFATAGASPHAGETAEVNEVLRGVLEDVPSGDGLVVEASYTRPTWVACSQGALASVLSNLVQNSVKYMRGFPDRQLKVAFRERGERVRVEVSDTGPGIPTGMEGRVFEPFVRLPGSNEPGLGLGLATVKKVVEGYGGSVGIARPEQGAVFWFELPAATAPAVAAELAH
jgi:signal transduction histidine kinase